MNEKQFVKEYIFFGGTAMGHSDAERLFTPSNFRRMFGAEFRLPEGLTWEKVREEAHRLIGEQVSGKTLK